MFPRGIDETSDMEWVNITRLCVEYRFSVVNFYIYAEAIQVRQKLESYEISVTID